MNLTLDVQGPGRRADRRPARKRNAMTRAMWAAVPGLLAQVADDVRVLLVTGTGPSFCAGADIGELLGGDDPADPMAGLRADNLAAQAALRAFPHPTIAVVRGHCIGGGWSSRPAATCASPTRPPSSA